MNTATVTSPEAVYVVLNPTVTRLCGFTVTGSRHRYARRAEQLELWDRVREHAAREALRAGVPVRIYASVPGERWCVYAQKRVDTQRP